MSNKLTYLRKSSKYKQEYICEIIGISKKTLYNYERDKMPIPSNHLIGFANLFKVSTDYILGIKKYTSIIVNDDKGEVLAAILNNEIIEHTGISVLFAED